MRPPSPPDPKNPPPPPRPSRSQNRQMRIHDAEVLERAHRAREAQIREVRRALELQFPDAPRRSLPPVLPRFPGPDPHPFPSTTQPWQFQEGEGGNRTVDAREHGYRNQSRGELPIHSQREGWATNETNRQSPEGSTWGSPPFEGEDEDRGNILSDPGVESWRDSAEQGYDSWDDETDNQAPISWDQGLAARDLEGMERRQSQQEGHGGEGWWPEDRNESARDDDGWEGRR